MSDDGPSLWRQLHVRFFGFHLKVLPYQYLSQDTGRLPLLFFALSALDVLGQVDKV